MNFKYFRRSTTTFSYNPCSIYSCIMLFFTSSVKNWASFALSLHFFIKSSRKMSVSFLKIWLYNFVDWPPFFCIYSVYLFNCVNISNINVRLLLIIFGILFIFKIIFHIIASLVLFSDDFINICLFINCLIVSVWSFFKWSIQLGFQIFNHLFSIE